MKKLLFKMKSFFIITYSKPFKDFENEYFQKTPEFFFMNGERKFSDKEKHYLKIIKHCFNPRIFKHN